MVVKDGGDGGGMGRGGGCGCDGGCWDGGEDSVGVVMEEFMLTMEV